jgi:prepilin-type N-terminal cleavage/methylation domain-containing protein
MKKGFTLSETLITLGILAVIAAFLIPSLMNSTPDQSRVMFKKAYSSIESNVSNIINDATNYPEDLTCTLPSGTKVDCGFSKDNVGAGTTVPAGQDKFCYLLADQMNVTGTSTCTAGSNGNFRTSDGISWVITTNAFPIDQTIYDRKIIVDVNGAKKPNCTDDTTGGTYGLSVCGTASDQRMADIFIVGVRYDGKLQVGATDAHASDILNNPTNNKAQ